MRWIHNYAKVICVKVNSSNPTAVRTKLSNFSLVKQKKMKKERKKKEFVKRKINEKKEAQYRGKDCEEIEKRKEEKEKNEGR